MLRRIFRVLMAAGSLLFGMACSSDALLKVGDQAPEVALLDQEGQEQRLSNYRGQPVVVFFYPKDDTPGCTKEACAFRDVWDRYVEANIAVIGVSADDVDSHKKFMEKHELPFTLLADTEAELGKAFGLKPKLGFLPRVSFLLDKEGVIQAVYPDVDPGVHAEQVLSDVGRLGL